MICRFDWTRQSSGVVALGQSGKLGLHRRNRFPARTLEHVDQLVLVTHPLGPHQKSPRHTDAHHFHIQPPCHLDVKNGQRDRDAFPIVDHFIQVTVGPVVKIGAAPVKAEPLEQIFVERL